jgi:hypothetical protein
MLALRRLAFRFQVAFHVLFHGDKGARKVCTA